MIESNHLFLSRKLFQEYTCEAWAVAEQERLRYIKSHQYTLHSEVYSGLVDADANLAQLCRRMILPSSFSGSTRNMKQLCKMLWLSTVTSVEEISSS